MFLYFSVFSYFKSKTRSLSATALFFLLGIATQLASFSSCSSHYGTFLLLNSVSFPTRPMCMLDVKINNTQIYFERTITFFFFFIFTFFFLAKLIYFFIFYYAFFALLFLKYFLTTTTTSTTTTNHFSHHHLYHHHQQQQHEEGKHLIRVTVQATISSSKAVTTTTSNSRFELFSQVRRPRTSVETDGHTFLRAQTSRQVLVLLTESFFFNIYIYITSIIIIEDNTAPTQ